MNIDTRRIVKIMRESSRPHITLGALCRLFGTREIAETWLASKLRNDSFLLEIMARVHENNQAAAIEDFLSGAKWLAGKRKGINPERLLIEALRATRWTSYQKEASLIIACGSESPIYKAWLSSHSQAKFSDINLEVEIGQLNARYA